MKLQVRDGGTSLNNIKIITFNTKRFFKTIIGG